MMHGTHNVTLTHCNMMHATYVTLTHCNMMHGTHVTLRYDAGYTQRHTNTLQYDARYTQRQTTLLPFFPLVILHMTNVFQFLCSRYQLHLLLTSSLSRILFLAWFGMGRCVCSPYLQSYSTVRFPMI